MDSLIFWIYRTRDYDWEGMACLSGLRNSRTPKIQASVDSEPQNIAIVKSPEHTVVAGEQLRHYKRLTFPM